MMLESVGSYLACMVGDRKGRVFLLHYERSQGIRGRLLCF